MKVSRVIGTGAAAAVLSVGLVAAYAQNATPAAPASGGAAQAGKVDPAAKALLSKMVAAHQKLTGFSGTMDFSAGTEGGTKTSFVLVKPNKAKIVSENTASKVTTTVVMDGTNLFSTTSSDAKNYVKRPAPTSDAALATAFGTSGGSGSGLILLILSDPGAAEKVLPPTVSSVEKLDDDTVGGVAVDVVKASFKSGQIEPTITFAIGKEDTLLRRVSISYKDPSGKDTALTETYSDIKVNPTPAAGTFAFTPPAGAKAQAAAPQPAMFDPRLKVGANPLPFSGVDTAGKPVSLAQYKGKVVLIDFWATWCGPCVAELPNVVSNYNKYRAQGFDVIGVSLDQPNQGSQVAAFTKKNSMPWRQIYDGKYWNAALAKAYGVQAIPFTLLIGKDGKIAAVGARGPALEPAIKAALAKK